jgi:hypothetical protein
MRLKSELPAASATPAAHTIAMKSFLRIVASLLESYRDPIQRVKFYQEAELRVITN